MERETLAKTLRLMRPRRLVNFRVRRSPVTKGKRIMGVRMDGGPVKTANLYSSGTLPFRLGSWYGYYSSENKWVDL